MNSTDRVVRGKLEQAERERSGAARLDEERAAIERELSRRAGIQVPFGPEPADSRLTAEQAAAFTDEADERRGRADQLDYEASRYEAQIATRTADRRRQDADDLRLLGLKIAAAREGAIQRATDLLVRSDGGHLDNKAFLAFMQDVKNATELDRSADQLAAMEQRSRKAAAHWQVKEPRVYGPDSPHSYYRDLAAGVEAIGGGGFGDLTGAQQRMAQYDRELAHEVRQRSPEGRRCERMIGEYYRSEIESANRAVVTAELRALVTGGGATASAAGGGGAAFVSPYFAWEALAPYRGIHRTFSDACGTMPLPDYGMQVYLPAFTTATSVTAQTEGQTVSETDPTTDFRSAQIETVTGQILMSQQLSDRGFTGNGGDFDRLMSQQLQQQLDQAVEQYTLAQALAGAATVSGSSSFSIANLYADLALGREKLSDTLGTRLRPTHVFTTSDLFSYITRQVDDQHRPIVVPTFAPGFPIAAGDAQAKWSRFTGVVLPGSTLWFTADGIPNLGTTNQTQIIISAPDEAMVLFEGEPILSVFPQADAVTLELVLNLRSYVAAAVRYPSGTASIAGTAYTSSLV